MPRVTEAHRASRRDQILDAATACFVADGFRGASMAEIIAASGLSAGSIYSYFPSKQELAKAVARRAVGGRVAQAGGYLGATPVPTPGAVIRFLGEGIAAVGVTGSLILQLWGESVSDPDLHGIAAELFAEFGGMFAAYLRRFAREGRGMPEADAETWAAEMLPVMLALAQGHIVQRTLLPSFDAERYFAGIDRLFG